MSQTEQHAAAPTAHYPINDEWVKRHQEEILEPELSIVDPHHHLWDRPGVSRRMYLSPLLSLETFQFGFGELCGPRCVESPFDVR